MRGKGNSAPGGEGQKGRAAVAPSTAAPAAPAGPRGGMILLPTGCVGDLGEKGGGRGPIDIEAKHGE